MCLYRTNNDIFRSTPYDNRRIRYKVAFYHPGDYYMYPTPCVESPYKGHLYDLSGLNEADGNRERVKDFGFHVLFKRQDAIDASSALGAGPSAGFRIVVLEILVDDFCAGGLYQFFRPVRPIKTETWAEMTILRIFEKDGKTLIWQNPRYRTLTKKRYVSKPSKKRSKSVR